MKTIRPKPLAPEVKSLPLTPEEGFVLSRIDGRLSVNDLVALTGIEAGRIERIVEKLASHGAVALESADASSGYLGDTGSSPVLGGAPPAPESKATLDDFAVALGLAGGAAPPDDEDTLRDVAEKDESAPVVALTQDKADATSAGAGEAAESASEDVAEEDDAANETDERNYRKVFETTFHPLSPDARVHAAKTEQGANLCALCFDPDARIIAAVLENPTVGLTHARLVALHHRTSSGLEMLTRRNDFLRDVLVERRLLRNPQCGEMVLQRIMGTKRLFQTYKIAIDREIPEITRGKARGHIRQKFQTAPPEERADLVIRTEGRCLIVMTGCTFDGKTTQILCGRPFHSVLFIQNLAKFTATPPLLLAHLMKQPFVKKNVPLRKLLLQHPNMPGDAKRNGRTVISSSRG